jgi:hypothetical protein
MMPVAFKEFLFAWDDGSFVAHRENPPGSGFVFPAAKREGVAEFVRDAKVDEEKRFGDMVVKRLEDVTHAELLARGWCLNGMMAVKL